MLNKTQLVVL